MKKILPLLVVFILALSGLVAVAIPNENQIENKPMNIWDWGIEINIKGGFLGYKVTVTNVGNTTISGKLNITILTDAWIMFSGSKLNLNKNLTIRPEVDWEEWLRGVSGIGYDHDNIINVSYCDYTGELSNWEKEVPVLVLLFFVRCNIEPIRFP